MNPLRLLLCLLALALGGTLAHATVTNSTSSTTIAGNGSQTVFTFNFIGVTANDITVIYTDTAGNQTIIPQGQYTLALNSALPGNVWGIGGSVTYPLIGSPIASGTTLTISRAVPNTQTVSSNQGTAFPTAVEAGLDLLAMQIQQLSAVGKVVQASPADSCSTLGFLPSAIQRANQVLGFDGTGCNPVAVSTLPSGTVSSAMQPVISAASLSAGRTAFGLGSVATEGIGACLQDDGGGNLRSGSAGFVQDSGNLAVTAGFYCTNRFSTAAITYTLPQASTLWNGFNFRITAMGGPITLALANAGDNFYGTTSGQSLIIPPGTTVNISTNAGVNWQVSQNGRIGFNAAIGFGIAATQASNKLTVAVKDLNGNDPSNTSPVVVGFRSQTLTNGAPIIGAITAPLSFTLNAASSMGCTTAVPCRLWGELICQTETSGYCSSVLVGVSAQSTATACYPLAENSLQTTGSGTGGGTSINTIQTSASALSNVAIRIAFYVEATWTNSVGWSNPTVVQIFGPGIARPCQVLQTIFPAPFSTTTNCQIANTQSAVTAAITPSSTANLVLATANGVGVIASGHLGAIQLSRGTTPTLIGNLAWFAVGTAQLGSMSVAALDAPATTSAVNYYLFCKSDVNSDFVLNGTTSGFTGTSTIMLQEIMGALDEPVNDNGPIRKAA